MAKEKETKRTIFTVTNLVIALLCFVVFLVAGVGIYYAMVEPYLTAQVWVLCVALAAVGAVAMFFHWYIFSVLYYIGCLLGWFASRWVAQLQGDAFTSNVWRIVLFVIIAVFAVLGLILQLRSFKDRHDRKKAEKEAAKAQQEAQAEAQRLSAELEEARREKEAAEAALQAAAAGPGQEPQLEEEPEEKKSPFGKLFGKKEDSGEETSAEE